MATLVVIFCLLYHKTWRNYAVILLCGPTALKRKCLSEAKPCYIS
jgi:hypothetical protein